MLLPTLCGQPAGQPACSWALLLWLLQLGRAAWWPGRAPGKPACLAPGRSLPLYLLAFPWGSCAEALWWGDGAGALL